MTISEDQLMKMIECVSKTLEKEIDDLAIETNQQHNAELFHAVSKIASRAVAYSIKYLQQEAGVSWEDSQ